HRLRQQKDLRTFESRNVCHAGFYRAKRGSGIRAVRLSTQSARLLHFLEVASWLADGGQAAIIFSLAIGMASRNVCIGVLP
ncbi:MAG: hypothetical protein ACR2KT_04565, partial [Methylocella sp.]